MRYIIIVAGKRSRQQIKIFVKKVLDKVIIL